MHTRARDTRLDAMLSLARYNRTGVKLVWYGLAIGIEHHQLSVAITLLQANILGPMGACMLVTDGKIKDNSAEYDVKESFKCLRSRSDASPRTVAQMTHCSWYPQTHHRSPSPYRASILGVSL